MAEIVCEYEVLLYIVALPHHPPPPSPSTRVTVHQKSRTSDWYPGTGYSFKSGIQEPEYPFSPGVPRYPCTKNIVRLTGTRVHTGYPGTLTLKLSYLRLRLLV